MEGYGIYYNREGGISPVTELSEKAVNNFQLIRISNIKAELLSEVATRLEDDSIQAIFFSRDSYYVMNTNRDMIEYPYGIDDEIGTASLTIELRAAIGFQGYITEDNKLYNNCPNHSNESRHKLFDLIQRGEYPTYDNKLVLITRELVEEFILLATEMNATEVEDFIVESSSKKAASNKSKFFAIASVVDLKSYDPSKMRSFGSMVEAIESIKNR